MKQSIKLGLFQVIFFPCETIYKFAIPYIFLLTNQHSYEMYCFGAVLREAAGGLQMVLQVSVWPKLTQPSKSPFLYFFLYKYMKKK